MLEQMPTRGFQSVRRSPPALRARDVRAGGLAGRGLAGRPLPDADRRRRRSNGHARAERGERPLRLRAADVDAPLFEDVTGTCRIDYVHRENMFFDYNREPLIPHRVSIEGPALAVGDVNGDGLDDIYAGGAKWQAGRLLVQRRDGAFRRTSERVFAADSLAEDVDAAFFDADGDGDLDLYVVSGGNEFWGEEEPLRDRLYVNDGQGNFRRAADALPVFHENGSTVAPGDFNRDGHIDLFVGGRVVSRNYGLTPRSRLLQNDGTGRFTDVTREKAEALGRAGMVTSAGWTDYDARRPARPRSSSASGCRCACSGRRAESSLIAPTPPDSRTPTGGGTASRSPTSTETGATISCSATSVSTPTFARRPSEPARLYVHDFFQNDALEQILTFHKHGVSYPMAGRDELVRLMPPLRSKYPCYASFGGSRWRTSFPRPT